VLQHVRREEPGAKAVERAHQGRRGDQPARGERQRATGVDAAARPGAAPDARAADGTTALMLAAANGFPGSIRRT